MFRVGPWRRKSACEPAEFGDREQDACGEVRRAVRASRDHAGQRGAHCGIVTAERDLDVGVLLGVREPLAGGWVDLAGERDHADPNTPRIEAIEQRDGGADLRVQDRILGIRVAHAGREHRGQRLGDRIDAHYAVAIEVAAARNPRRVRDVDHQHHIEALGVRRVRERAACEPRLVHEALDARAGHGRFDAQRYRRLGAHGGRA